MHNADAYAVCNAKKAHLDETTHGEVRASTRLRKGEKGKRNGQLARALREERSARRTNDWRERERKEENEYGDARERRIDMRRGNK